MTIDFDKLGGLIPAVVQCATTRDVLMVAYMNDEALQLTIETKRATFFSRTRSSLWIKGESSGHLLHVRSVRMDCDGDAVLVEVDAVGPGVCHEGYRSCFFRVFAESEWQVEGDRAFDPQEVYAR